MVFISQVNALKNNNLQFVSANVFCFLPPNIDYYLLIALVKNISIINNAVNFNKRKEKVNNSKIDNVLKHELNNGNHFLIFKKL